MPSTSYKQFTGAHEVIFSLVHFQFFCTRLFLTLWVIILCTIQKKRWLNTACIYSTNPVGIQPRVTNPCRKSGLNWIKWSDKVTWLILCHCALALFDVPHYINHWFVWSTLSYFRQPSFSWTIAESAVKNTKQNMSCKTSLHWKL